MAGPTSNYADEIHDAILTAIENQAGKGRRYELPTGATPADTQYFSKRPEEIVPADVAHMVMGMQLARKPRDQQ